MPSTHHSLRAITLSNTASLIGLLSASLLIVPAAIARAPFLAEARPWLWLATAAAATILALVARRRRQNASGHGRRIATLTLMAAALALAVGLWIEGNFQHQRWRVLAAAPGELERIGAHVMVGYRDIGEIRRLVERRAIGGIFVTRRNVAGRSAEAIRAEIQALQSIRTAQGLPPLWIATDQEGGLVSRLSPPLTRLPVLAMLIRGVENAAGLGPAHLKAIDDYADTHGRELASVGVNLNFSPVVDIDHGLRNPDDAFSRIGERAISRDPHVVAMVAGRYCDGLARHGVRCTLKHFPGLGRVFEDTHVHAGRLDAKRLELEATDWIPFARSSHAGGHFTMVGHVVARDLDPNSVATLSRAVIAGRLRLIRGDAPVITDDMCMGPIHWDYGIGRAGIAALEAGADMLLVSWDGTQVYPLLSALLDWSRAGGPAVAELLATSRKRLGHRER